MSVELRRARKKAVRQFIKEDAAPAKTIKKTKSDLSDWSRGIEQAGERMRLAQEAKVKALKAGLPAEIKKLAKHDNDMLLDVMLNASAKRFGYDKAENDIWAKLYVAARKRIIKRMEK